MLPAVQTFEARIFRAIHMFVLYMSQEAPKSSMAALLLVEDINKLLRELEALALDMEKAQYTLELEGRMVDGSNLLNLASILDEKVSATKELFVCDQNICFCCGRP